MEKRTLLTDGDADKGERIMSYVKKFGPLLSVVAYLGGIIYFLMLPHELLIHHTYISENALSPGLVSSDIYSTDLLNNYYELLKSHYESQIGTSKRLDIDFVKELFSDKVQIETYVQHFNLTDPFENGDTYQFGRNIYAYARTSRADGTESIVVSAPLHLNDKRNKITPNFIGLAQLMQLAELVKSKPYWAKDLVFVVSDMGQVGIQAWINSYYDIKADYINSEGLKKRAGSIQAALNLEIKDENVDQIELKLEGANGKLPNLDLFNSIIRICKSVQFKCSLESEKFEQEHSYYHHRPPVEHIPGIENTISMLFKQATGIPTSSHGYFLNHRIEALTIAGVKSATNFKRQNSKQNLLKVTRIIEGTLRSINNLLERFHQSFFFYLLPSSHTYISIGMYMPAFGLVSLPLLVQIISIWCELFFKKNGAQFSIQEKRSVFLGVFRIVMANMIVSSLFGLMLYYGTPYFVYFGKMMELSPKDSLINCYMAITVNIFATPFLVNAKLSLKSIADPKKKEHIKTISDNLLKLIVIVELVIFLGTISVLNFSLAFLISLFYVPVTLLTVMDISNILLKGLRLMILLVASPLFYFTILFLIYSAYINSNFKLYEQISDHLYELAFLSKVSGIWTYDIINLCLIPIWTSLWLMAFPKFS